MASNKITKKDLNEMAVRSMAEQCCFSFERMLRHDQVLP